LKAYSTIHKNHDSNTCPTGNRVYFKRDAAYNAIEGRANFIVCSIDIEQGDTSLNISRGTLTLLKDVEINYKFIE